MNLQTYQADSMAEALAKVKKDLGRDAVILHTRTFKARGLLGVGRKTRVEITAALGPEALPTRLRKKPPGGTRTDGRASLRGCGEEESFGNVPRRGRSRTLEDRGAPVPRAPARSKPDAETIEMKAEIQAVRDLVQQLLSESRRGQIPQMPDALRQLYEEMIANQVADELARELIESIQGELTGQADVDAAIARSKLLETIESMLPTAEAIPIHPGQGPRILAMVGPTGVGKTTTIAKLAANFRLRENRKVGLITIDTYRIAAVDQLKTYAKIIDVPLAVVLSPEELQPAIRKMSDCEVILIDTAGRSQNDETKLAELKRFLDCVKPHEVHLVLSSTNHSSVLMQTVEQFMPLGVDRIIFTKLDESVGFGVILNVIRKVDGRLSFVTTGQDVPNDIERGNGRRLAEAILHGTFSKSQRARARAQDGRR